MHVIVAGALANKPFNGGEAWVRLSWIRGLQRMGAEVLFVERITSDVCADATGAPSSFRDSANLRWFDDVTLAFGLTGRSCLIHDDGEAFHGMSGEALADHAASADLLVNISGHLTIPHLFELPAVRAYVDIDPGFTQFWMADPASGFRVPTHDLWFTIGENIGSSDCAIPPAGIDWLPVRQPVVLGDWAAGRPDGNAPFSTVASWRGAFGPVMAGGRSYGLKVHEFRKVVDLPRQVSERLRIALDIHPGDGADRDRLVASGWDLVDPRVAAGDPFAFRDFVIDSKAEFSVAQGIYVETNSGWFSDRTTRYLAAGRPAVVQDTGFRRHLPAGEGLLAFHDADEARAAIEAVASDYERHATAARRIAAEYFDHARVLAGFLDRTEDARERRSRAMRAERRAESDVRLEKRNPSRREVTPGSRATADFDRRDRGTAASARAGKAGPLRILVSGMLAGVPGQGGASWAVLQYVLGLIRLGHDVRFIEPVDQSDAAWRCSTRYLSGIADAFALHGRMGLIRSGTTETHGYDYADVESFAGRSEVLINLSGLLREPALFEPPRVRVYVDLDPAFTQLWHAEQGVDMKLGGHTHFATVGLSIGGPSCDVPTCGLDWLPTVQPVVLDQWPAREPPGRETVTTVANWRGYGSIERNGTLFGQKAHSLRELIALPTRSPVPIEIALAIHPDETADLIALNENGWKLLDPAESAATPERYRDFIRGSWAELGAAKSGYVKSRCGWFSDRSLCYLATGRPVIAQETGFSEHLPTGEGIVPFDDADGAAAAIEAVRGNYERHARAARRLAEITFDSDTVLSSLLERTAA